MLNERSVYLRFQVVPALKIAVVVVRVNQSGYPNQKIIIENTPRYVTKLCIQNITN